MASNAAERQECSYRYTEDKSCTSFFIHAYTVPQHRQLHCLTVSAISYPVRPAWPPGEPLQWWCIWGPVISIFPKVQVTSFWQHVCALHMLRNWISTLFWSTEERMKGIEEELSLWITGFTMKQSMTLSESCFWHLEGHLWLTLRTPWRITEKKFLEAIWGSGNQTHYQTKVKKKTKEKRL